MTDKVELLINVAKTYVNNLNIHSALRFICEQENSKNKETAEMILVDKVYDGYLFGNLPLIYEIACGPFDNVDLMKAYVNNYEIRSIEIMIAIFKACKQGHLGIATFLNEHYKSLIKNHGIPTISETEVNIWFYFHETCLSGKLDNVKWFYENIMKYTGTRFRSYGIYERDIRQYIVHILAY